ncbi:MAG: sulfurtransferase [Bryobacteraceae bacterium]
MRGRLLGTLCLLPCLTMAASALRTDMLVSTDWLAQHLKDPKIVIIQVSRDRKAYDAGHVPGARFLVLTDIAITRDGILNELAPAGDLKSVFERLGVSDDSRVILYGDASVLPATRAYFTLDYLGHGDQTALLDGGLPKWQAESRALAKDTPEVKAGHFTPHPRPEIVIDLNSAKDLSFAAANAFSSSPVLLDARTAPEFQGKSAASEITRPGHIPGAANVYWMDGQKSKDDMSLQTEAALRKLYEAAGVVPNRPVVTYCNTGMQASQSYFTLKYLGYDARMYDGSYSEWSSAKGTEVQK